MFKRTNHHIEYLANGEAVRIQCCVVCDQYLGCNSLSDRCPAHQKANKK
jgi:hypothetical protein